MRISGGDDSVLGRTALENQLDCFTCGRILLIASLTVGSEMRYSIVIAMTKNQSNLCCLTLLPRVRGVYHLCGELLLIKPMGFTRDDEGFISQGLAAPALL